ncbi:14684_t:CDS:2, partial [Ambispora leptoticha]
MKLHKITFTVLSLIGLVSAAVTTSSSPSSSSSSSSSPSSSSSVKPPGSGQAALTGYPTMDQTPPTNQAWFRKVDLSQVPNIPPRKSFTDCPPKGSSDPTCAWSCSQCLASDDITFCPNKGDWGLTFDDGPASSQTGKLLTTLDGANQKATFFIVGSRVVEFPDTLTKTFKAGHQIGVHTWSHPPLTTLTNEQIVAEILWTEKIINDTIGVVPKYMRPPMGDIDNRVRAIMKALVGLPIIVDHGFCSLEHDIHTISVDAVPSVLPLIKNAGYKPQPIATCLGDNNPYQSLLSGSSGNNNNTSSSSGKSGNSSVAGSGLNSSSNDPSVNIKSTSD